LLYFNTSVRTIQRRKKEWGIERFWKPAPQELDAVVTELKADVATAMYGTVFVTGLLQSQGKRVAKRKVWEALSRTGNTVPKNLYSIPRRVADYSRPWHVACCDGHEKLFMYGFYIYGIIDGHSRYLVMLQAFLTKEAARILQAFRDVVCDEQIGYPDILMTDGGSEIVDVQAHMVLVKGGSDCLRIGSSCHNPTIERTWLTLRSRLGDMVKAVFNTLPFDQSDVDLNAMQRTYFNWVQNALDTFRSTFNHHWVRSTRNPQFNCRTAGKRPYLEFFVPTPHRSDHRADPAEFEHYRFPAPEHFWVLEPLCSDLAALREQEVTEQVFSTLADEYQYRRTRTRELLQISAPQ